MTKHAYSQTDPEKQWKNIYFLGGTMTIVALVGIVLDVIIGTVTGGDLSALPKTAVDRFIQFQEQPFLGLYNLDLLNVVNQLILVPVYYALYVAHRSTCKPQAGLTMIIFIVGTTVFVTTNTALPMLDLSGKYAGATDESYKSLLAAAGEAMLARGEHGSPGAIIGFLLPNIAGIMMSYIMLKGKVFSKMNAYIGIAGSILMVLYVTLVAFVPEVQGMATAFAAPGGFFAMVWMILFTIKLFQLSGIRVKKELGDAK